MKKRKTLKFCKAGAPTAAVRIPYEQREGEKEVCMVLWSGPKETFLKQL
jgi:hypothetical protein